MHATGIPRPAQPLGAAVDWPAVLAEHRGWLRTVALARTGEPQAVEEVMQEIALAVVHSSAGPADAAKIAPWLYRVAVRQALIYRRKLGRMRKTQNQYADRLRPGETADRSSIAPTWMNVCA